MPQFSITFIDTFNPLSFPLIPLSDECWPIGVLTSVVTGMGHLVGKAAGLTVEVLCDEMLRHERKEWHIFRASDLVWCFWVHMKCDQRVCTERPSELYALSVSTDGQLVHDVTVAFAIHQVLHLTWKCIITQQFKQLILNKRKNYSPGLTNTQ